MRRGAGGRVGSGWRGVRPRLDVRPPNPTRAPGTPSPLWPVGGFGSESARVPSSQLRPFRPPRAPYPPAGRPGRGLRPKGRRARRRPQPPGSAASGASALSNDVRVARSGVLRKPSGRPRQPPNSGSARRTSLGS